MRQGRGAIKIPNHLAVAPAAFSTNAQRATSLSTNLCRACGVRSLLSGISEPIWSRRLRVASSSSALTTASFNLAWISCGKFFGANIAFQAETWNSASPPSLVVGTSLTTSERSELAIAMALIVPAWICETTAVREMQAKSTWPATNVVDCWTGTAIGDAGRLCTHDGVQERARGVHLPASAPMCLVHLVLVPLNVLDKLLEIVGREILLGDDHDWQTGRLTYRREILDWIVLEIGILRRRGAVRSQVAHHESVTVSHGLRHAPGGGCAAGAGIILYDDGPTECLCHVVADNARNCIRRPSGRERYDQGDVALREIGRCREDPCK